MAQNIVYLADGFATSSVWVPVPPFMSAFGASVTVAAQDPSAVEAALEFDRLTRRLIQQGLRNESFDLRTRDAVRRWQQARGVPVTGYLNREQAELLRASGAPPPPRSENVEPPATSAEGANAPADSASESAAALVAGETALTAQAGQDGDSSRPAARPPRTPGNFPLSPRRPASGTDRTLYRRRRLWRRAGRDQRDRCSAGGARFSTGGGVPLHVCAVGVRCGFPRDHD